MPRLSGGGASSLTITDTFVVGSQAAMLALSTAQKGDIAIRTDENKTYILKAEPFSTLGNWEQLLFPLGLQGTGVINQVAVFDTTTSVAGSSQFTYIGGGFNVINVGPNTIDAGAGSVSVFGYNNVIGVTSAGSIIGGSFNTASSITGNGIFGYTHNVIGLYHLTSGSTNINHGLEGVFVGGETNEAGSSAYNSIVYGYGNIVGGTGNVQMTAVFGYANTVDTLDKGLVFGGQNSITGNYNIVGGLLNSSASGTSFLAVFGESALLRASSHHNIVTGLSQDADGSYNAQFGEGNVSYSSNSHSIVGGETNGEAGGHGIIGGKNNALGQYATFCIMAGEDNLWGSAFFSDHTAIFGQNNSKHGKWDLVAGQGNSVDNSGSAFVNHSIIVGLTHSVGNVAASHASATFGESNTVNAPHSLTFGLKAKATFEGQFVHTVNSGTVGDRQTSQFTLWTQTTDATVTELPLDGASAFPVLEDGKVYFFKVHIIGNQGSATQTGAYDLTFAFKRPNAAGSTVNGLIKTVVFEDDVNWDVDVTADTTNGRPAIKVTGVAATTINWVARVQMTETI